MKRQPRYKVYLMKLKIRIKACYRILTRKYDHWVILNLDDDNFTKLLNGDPFETTGVYHGIQPYIYHKMIKQVSASKDDIELALDKAQFEADATMYKRK